MEVERLKHGTNIVEDPDLVELVAKMQIGLASCPLSNDFVSPEMKGEEIISLLKAGVKVSINSDDPVYFKGYISDNYYALAQKYQLSQEQIVQLAKNSFESSWISQKQKELYLAEINSYVAKFSK